MDTDAMLFYSVVAIITTFFLRVVFINIKVRRYIRKYHRNFWEENIHLFFGGGKAGPNIFQITKSIDDPKIKYYKKKWNNALKQLFLVVLLVTILIVCHIILKGK
jgi:hypothetical protein